MDRWSIRLNLILAILVAVALQTGCKPSNVINISSLTPETDDSPDDPGSDLVLANLYPLIDDHYDGVGIIILEWITSRPTPVTIEYSPDDGATWVELATVPSGVYYYEFLTGDMAAPDGHYTFQYHVGSLTVPIGTLWLDTTPPQFSGATVPITGCDNQGAIAVTMPTMTDNLPGDLYIETGYDLFGGFYCISSISDCYYDGWDSGAINSYIAFRIYDMTGNYSSTYWNITVNLTDCP